MFKSIVKIMSLIMIVLLVLSLAACGGKSGGSPEEQPENINEIPQEEEEIPEADLPEEPEPESEYPKAMYISTEDGLLLRDGPGTENNAIHLLSYGDEIQVEKMEDGWAYTTVDGVSGWCSAEYLTEDKDIIKQEDKSASVDPNKLVEPSNESEYGFHGYVNTPEGLNMRYGPGTEYGIICAIPNKTELTEEGWEDGWVYTQYKGKHGWISAEYFAMEGGKEKPVIYLYPTHTIDVFVRVSLADGYFTRTIPEGNGEWTVTAEPSGKLTDKASGKSYDYIFWESTDGTEYDWSEGYVVEGYETENFLRRVLPEMGLNKNECSEFIKYWLPRMEKNRFNLICFQTDCYTDAAKLEVSPEPDSVLRVFMTFKEVAGPVSVSHPSITPFERKGFTVVEWGGAECTNRNN